MWGLTSAVALLAAGCFHPHPATGSPCTADSECPTELVCSHGSCEVTVAPDDAAPSDQALPDVAIDAPTGPMLVQQVIASADRAATLGATLPAAPAPGNVLLMIGGNQHTSLTSVTGGGATWTKITGSNENANIEVWFGIADGSHTPVMLDCAVSGCETQPIWMHLSEWSGLAGASAVGPSIASNGLTSPVHVGSITTTATNLIVFAFSDASPNTVGVPAPGTWTKLDEVMPVAVMQNAWYLVGGPGTYGPAVTETAHSWDAALVVLRPR
jgi:hypothetical protein